MDDVPFLLFGQAMPGLDADTRMDVVYSMSDAESAVALALLVSAIDAEGIEGVARWAIDTAHGN